MADNGDVFYWVTMSMFMIFMIVVGMLIYQRSRPKTASSTEQSRPSSPKTESSTGCAKTTPDTTK